MSLTQERLKALLHYDPETGLFTRLIRPGKRSDLIGSVAGYFDMYGYVIINVDNRKYRAHVLAWFYMTGAWPAALMDHKNLAKSDNRWVNLREATKSQNEQNKRPSSANTSGVKGVYWSRCTKKWQAYIKKDGKYKYLGIFARFEDAVAARRMQEQRLFGEYAYQEGATA